MTKYARFKELIDVDCMCRSAASAACVNAEKEALIAAGTTPARVERIATERYHLNDRMPPLEWACRCSSAVERMESISHVIL